MLIIMLYSQQVQTKKKTQKTERQRQTERERERERERETNVTHRNHQNEIKSYKTRAKAKNLCKIPLHAVWRK